MTQMLRKRTLALRGDVDDFGAVAPPSPTRRRSRQIPVYDYSSGEENGGPPTPPLTPTRSSSRTKMATSHPLESTPTRRKGILTPQMTPSSDKAQLRKGSNNSNNSTGLTPALNRTLNLINDPVAPRDVLRNKTQSGYSTPASLARSKSNAELGAKPVLSRTLSGTANIPRSAASATEQPSVVGYYQEAKALFRRSTEPDHLVGRDEERTKIHSFYEEHILKLNAGSLYISGQPGTGKTALLKEVMRKMEPEVLKAKHEVKVANINCMAIKDPRFVYQKMLEELGYTANATDKDAAMLALEKLVLDSKKNIMFVTILDEIDQLVTKDQEVLYKLFQWASAKGSRFTLIGIANALDMTERLLPRLKAKGCEPKVASFNPYNVKQIQDIIKARLLSLGSNQADVDASGETAAESTKTPRVAPLIDSRAIEMCARKVAAGNGDLRRALDICRQSLELVEQEAKKKERACEVTKLRRLPLQEITAAQAMRGSNIPGGANERRAGTPSSRSSSPGVFTDENTGEVLLDERDGITLVPIEEAPKVTIGHVRRALEVASGTVTSRALNSVNFNQKIILAALVMKMRSGKMADCQVGNLFEYYTHICRTFKVEGFRPALRSEFDDLLGMTESVGIVTLDKTKEQRFRHVSLVLQTEEVLKAIRMKDHTVDNILLKQGL